MYTCVYIYIYITIYIYIYMSALCASASPSPASPSHSIESGVGILSHPRAPQMFGYLMEYLVFEKGTGVG